MKKTLKQIKADMQQCKEFINANEGAMDSPEVIDRRQFYQNLNAEKARIKGEKKLAKKQIKE